MTAEEKSDARYKWLMLGLLAVTYFLMHSARQGSSRGKYFWISRLTE